MLFRSISILKVTPCYGGQETIIVTSTKYFRIGKNLKKNIIYNFKVTASIKDGDIVFFMQSCKIVRLDNVVIIDR